MSAETFLLKGLSVLSAECERLRAENDKLRAESNTLYIENDKLKRRYQVILRAYNTLSTECDEHFSQRKALIAELGQPCPVCHFLSEKWQKIGTSWILADQNQNNNDNKHLRAFFNGLGKEKVPKK